MATSILNKLAGKKIVLKSRGKYDLMQVKSMIKAHGGTLVEDLDARTDYLVLSDLSTGVTVQKQAATLNGKGASIQVIDAAAMQQMLTPTDAEVIAILRAGGDDVRRLNEVRFGAYRSWHTQTAPSLTIAAESFDKSNLSNAALLDIAFEQCSFVRCTLCDVAFEGTRGCDFTEARGGPQAGGGSGASGPVGVSFQDVTGSKFLRADLRQAGFDGVLSDADFTEARLDGAEFRNHAYHRRGGPVKQNNVTFVRAKLTEASFEEVEMVAPNFQEADLGKAKLVDCDLERANFRGISAVDADFAGSKLRQADFTGSDLRGANFGNADLTGARMAGADLAGCNFRGATLANVDFSKARNYEPAAATVGTVGPALTELDQLVKQARNIVITVNVGSEGEGEPMRINSASLTYGWGVSLPASIASRRRTGNRGQTLSDALLQAANLIGDRKIRYETLDVSSSKSPKGGKELRELTLKGLAEAFAQPLPAEEDLAAATRAYRDKDREKNAAAREAREKEKAAAEKAREKEKKAAEKKIEKAVGGKVKDIGTFLTALELRIEKEKIKKATSMLKKAGFQLYNDVTDTFMSGVVKSQTDPDLVYACRISQDGKYACCTQNLNICGGLRGSICKHLLVLIIGLVKAEKLDPTVIDGWVAKSMHEKAALDKEVMGEIFIKYKGAEAGEVDWRPTETLPEDYYAV